MRRRQCQRALRVFVGQILLGVERVGEVGIIVVLPAAPAVGVVALQKPVPVQVCRSLSAESRSRSVNEVARDHRVYRSDVEFARCLLRSRLHEILYRHLEGEESVFEVARVLYVAQKLRHPRLRPRQRHHSHLLPEHPVADLGVGLVYLLLLPFEMFRRYGVEKIVCHPRVSYHYRLGEYAEQ